MNYYYNIQNAQKELKRIQLRMTQFNKLVELTQKNSNLFKKDILDPNGEVAKLQKLRKHCKNLMSQLDAQLKGGQKRYAKSRAERQSSHFQGSYGNLKGHNRLFHKQLKYFLHHIDTLIKIVKGSDSDRSRTWTATVEAAGQNVDQYKETGGFMDASDPLVVAALLLVAIKKLIKKN